MRSLALVLLVAACGGGARSASTMPANDAPDPLRKESGAGDPAPPPAVVDNTKLCENRADEFGPIILSAELAATRHGTGAKKFADAPSSKEKPIEVCGIPASRAWLMGTTCADGSRAYPNAEVVAQSRAGNVGPGGRCASIIDHYVAKCPEAAYDVYIDMYMCGPNESF